MTTKRETAKETPPETTPQAVPKGPTRLEKLSLYLVSEAPKLKELAPPGYDWRRGARILAISAMRVPTLLQCTPQSIVRSLGRAFELGLDPGGALGDAYLIPRRMGKAVLERWKGTDFDHECELQLGYQGLITLARRSGEVQRIEARSVYVGDHFRLAYGTRPIIEHEPRFVAEAEKRGYYAVAFLREGEPQFEYMTFEQVVEVRNKAAADTPAWREWFDEMAKKTVIRRLSKLLPKSAEMRHLLEREDATSFGDLNVIDDGDSPEGVVTYDKPHQVGGKLRQVMQDQQAKKARPVVIEHVPPVAPSPPPPESPTPAPDEYPPHPDEEDDVDMPEEREPGADG